MPPRTPCAAALLRLRATVTPDGDVDAFGLTYRVAGHSLGLAALACAGHGGIVVDASDIGTVLVRDPLTGALLRADCTRPAYARGLSLPAHAAARRRVTTPPGIVKPGAVPRRPGASHRRPPALAAALRDEDGRHVRVGPAPGVA